MRSLPNHLEVYITSDGSPTLSTRREDGYIEKMHHSGGALSESLFLYGEAFDLACAKGWPLRVLSVGLGLAYNELIAFAKTPESQLNELHIHSFETDAELSGGFANWLNSDTPESQLGLLYEEVLGLVASAHSLEPSELKSRAKDAWRAGRFKLHGRFPEEAHGLEPFNVVFFDAFSSKMSPELWLETAMFETFSKLLAPRCVLTTYAATGALNRVLRQLQFDLVDKPGFQGKRQCTLAIRGG